MSYEKKLDKGYLVPLPDRGLGEVIDGENDTVVCELLKSCNQTEGLFILFNLLRTSGLIVSRTFTS